MKCKLTKIMILFLLFMFQGYVYSNVPHKFSKEADFYRKQLYTIGTFKCFFLKYSSAKFSNNNIQIKHGKQKNFTFIFTGINRVELTAKMIGNQGTATVRVMPKYSGTHFFETTVTGNLNVTTLFVEGAHKQIVRYIFPAVHSRHISIVRPIPSQYYGYCISHD